MSPHLVAPCAVCCAQHEPEAAVPLEVDPEPFSYRPLPRSNHTYAMVDGVVRVWEDEAAAASGAPDLFPIPGSAADFFTDMHRVLRYASLGPVKSFSHHRCVGTGGEGEGEKGRGREGDAAWSLACSKYNTAAHSLIVLHREAKQLRGCCVLLC